MNAYLLLVVESLISAAASLVVLHAVSQPLVDVLGRICPDPQAATFWQVYTKVMLLIAPLFLVLSVDMLTHFSDPSDSLRLAVLATLAGLMLGMRAIGKRLGQFVDVPERDREAS